MTRNILSEVRNYLTKFGKKKNQIQRVIRLLLLTWNQFNGGKTNGIIVCSHISNDPGKTSYHAVNHVSTLTCSF